MGEWSFNKRCSKTGQEKKKAKHIAVAVPPIIAPDAFETVQATRKAHNPRVTPARVVTGPILLTGFATCTTCAGAMTLRTGTSKSKKVHSYSSCSTKGRQGATGCSGRSIRMATLDTLVTDHLVAELLQPDRLRAVLAPLWALKAERAAEVRGRGAVLRSEFATAEEKLRRLYRLVENGEDEPDDLLKVRLSALRAKRDLAKAALGRFREAGPSPFKIDPELSERFGRLMRANVTSGEIPFRKAWLQAIVDRVEVGADVVRIVGDKENLDAALAEGDGTAVPGVRNSVRKWRARQNETANTYVIEVAR